MLCQQRPRKRRKKHNRRNIFRMILGLVLISVISICAIRLFYRSRSSPPSDSDSDYIIMAADQNGNVSDTPIENSTDADLLQTLQTLKKTGAKNTGHYRSLSGIPLRTPRNVIQKSGYVGLCIGVSQ